MLIDGPVETVAAAFHALQQRDWQALAKRISPESLRQIQQMQTGSLLALELFPFDSATRSGGSMVAINSKGIDASHERTRIRAMPGSPTLAELRALSPTDFFVQWQEACYRRSVWLRLYAWIWGLFHKEDQQDDPPAVVGVVLEGNDLAHVVYRRSGLMHPWERSVLTVRRDGDGWLLVLDQFSHADPFREGQAWLMMRAMTPRFFKAKLTSWLPWTR